MKPRSVRFREKARGFGLFSFICLMCSVLGGSLGYVCQSSDWIGMALTLYAMAFVMFIASIALFVDMLDSYQASEREEYWESKYPANHHF